METKNIMIVGVGGQPQADLLLAGETVGCGGPSPGVVQRRQQQSGKDYDDCDNDQQFYQGK